MREESEAGDVDWRKENNRERRPVLQDVLARRVRVQREQDVPQQGHVQKVRAAEAKARRAAEYERKAAADAAKNA